MAGALHRRPLQGFDTRHGPIAAAGGLFVADPEADPEALRAEIAGRDVRALAVPPAIADLSFLAGLAIEFLTVGATNVDVAPLATCRSLRALGLDSWQGTLHVAGLPDLEWFAVTEIEPGQLEQVTGPGHARLHHVSVGRYRHRDLEPLTSLPRLVHLDLVDARSLSSLLAVADLPALRRLDLTACRDLRTLDGLEGASELESLTLEDTNGVQDLQVLAELPKLQALKLDSRTPPSVTPLVGHPSLAHVWLVGGTRPDSELTALLDNAAMTTMQSSRRAWMRTDGGWEHVTNLYDMPPEQLERYEHLHEARWSVMAW